MTQTTDSQRQRVYDAEIATRAVLDNAVQAPVFDFHGSTLILPEYRRFGSIEAVQRYLDAVMNLNWVKDTWGVTRPITVKAARSDARRAVYTSLHAIIRVPDRPYHMNELTILHEFAHHLTRADMGHGKAFAGTLVRLFSEIIGQPAGLILTDAMVNNGVEIDYAYHM